VHSPLAVFDGYCASCSTERPLVVIEHGPRGVSAWLAGVGPEDRTLSHTCRVCGRNEHVPLTEAEDEEYDHTLPRWPDTVLADVPAPVRVEVSESYAPPAGDVFAAAALHLLATPQEPAVVPVARKPRVHVVTLPVRRVQATDRILALAVA
jgi:hypothetical protein